MDSRFGAKGAWGRGGLGGVGWRFCRVTKEKCYCEEMTQLTIHTPSIAFRHLPPNSARFSYATEGALFISAQLSSDAVSAL